MSFPLVALASIAPSGLRTPVGPWARQAAEEAAAGELLALDGDIELLRRGVHVLARGSVLTRARVACDRCGAPLELALGGAFACVYSPLAAVPEGDEEDEGAPVVPAAFAGEADEVSEYEGDGLDLRQVVREFLALERPARVLCADLDPAHDEACLARWKDRAGEQTPSTLSPFAALAALKPS